MNLFDWLNEVTYYKRPWSTFTDEDKTEFNTYMINRFISMNSSYIDIVNLIQQVVKDLAKEKADKRIVMILKLIQILEKPLII